MRYVAWFALLSLVAPWTTSGNEHVGDAGSPLDNPMYSIVWTIEWDGLLDGVVHWNVPSDSLWSVLVHAGHQGQPSYNIPHHQLVSE